MKEVHKILKSGLEKLEIQISIEPLLSYLSLLAKWNRVYNLTAIRGLESMATRHLLDSLAILPQLKNIKNLNDCSLLDVGSGPGLPGIPIALYNPFTKVTLIDSNGKKVRFLQEVKRQLAISNLEIIYNRIENFYPEEKFDIIISRAFGDVSSLLSLTTKNIKENGFWVAMKGHHPKNILITLPFDILDYKVPGLEEARCIIIVKNLNNN